MGRTLPSWARRTAAAGEVSLNRWGRTDTGEACEAGLKCVAGMASGELIICQQVGFGLAVAIILDATIIRMVLVPASMELLGLELVLPALA